MKERVIGFKFDELTGEDPILIKYESEKNIVQEIEDATQSYFESALNEYPDFDEILHIIKVIMDSFGVHWGFVDYSVIAV